MSSKSTFGWLAAAVVVCTISTASAQDLLPAFMTPGEYSPSGTTAPYSTAFDGDLQFFTPFEDGAFGDLQAEPIGWFGQYKRCYWNVSAPEQSQQADGDFGWGNRYDIGFTTPDGAGWMCDILDMSGPNLPLNSSEMSGFSFDRMWQMPLSNGTMLMPNFAVRYVNIIDRTVPITDSTFGEFDSAGRASPTKNSIIGGQMGLGWQMRRGAWQVQTNAKLYCAENFQVFTSQFVNSQSEVATGPGTSRREFVPAGELNLNMNYSLTRDIAVNIGWDMLYFGRGIARQGQVEFNDENMMYTGVGFGLTFNR